MEKIRKINGSDIVFRYNLSSLEECDRLESNYTLMKLKKIKQDEVLTVKKIKEELAAKLEKIEKDKEIQILVSSSFGWLAILMICLVFLINGLIDSQKLICYLKKYYCVKKRLNEVAPQKKEKPSSNKQKSVFRQVVEKEKNLLNHAYFQKRRELKLKD